MKIQGILTQGKWLDFNNMDYSTCAACKDDIKLKNCRCSRGGGEGYSLFSLYALYSSAVLVTGFWSKKKEIMILNYDHFGLMIGYVFNFGLALVVL